MSQELKRPTALICTSGTAAYNFSPAVAEAFFSKRPLIVFTADRPTEWVGQQDGQTIFQNDIFGKHVKKSYQLPQEYDHRDNVWAINRIINEAINLAQQEPQGPVHINAPFREPLYPVSQEEIGYSERLRIMEDETPVLTVGDHLKKEIAEAWPSYHNVLIVAGQLDTNELLVQSLSNFLSVHNIPIVGDILSNLHPIEKCVRHADLFLGHAPDGVLKTLRPDLLITLGDSTLSKNLKGFLRQCAALQHWHIQAAGPTADTFQSITKIIRIPPHAFFDFLSTISQPDNFKHQKQNNYSKLWEVEERRIIRALNEYFPQENLGELEVVKEIIGSLPPDSNLHLANSMSVRYANFIGLTSQQKTIRVFANRGTSGIDGCTSTSIGHSLVSNVPNVLFTGDVAFFYDRNAFWHNYPTPNLRVVLLNNHGGIIFKMIDGPGKVDQADEYFVTHQRLNGKKLCEEYSIDYLKVDNRRKVKNLTKDFFDFDGKAKLLEIESDLTMNKNIFDNLKQKIRKTYEL
jgi:2-succinyl-5-enolpyruvyl-6-hydroxy-3-cyclohexene-1-carboxylate synthase